MATAVTTDSLLDMVITAGKLSQDEVTALIERWESEGLDVQSAKNVAMALVDEKYLSAETAAKLLEGEVDALFELGPYRVFATLRPGRNW